MNTLKVAGTMAGLYAGTYLLTIGTVTLAAKGVEKVAETIGHIKETHRINHGIPEQFKGRKIHDIYRWQYQAV